MGGHICPFSIDKPELCRAAVSSLMINATYCRGAYEECPIYAIESKRIAGLLRGGNYL